MRGRDRRQRAEVKAEINVTSLVDVAFTLLIIFIITAPILQGGIEVAIPRADVRPLTTQDEPLMISVTRDGTIYLEETAFSMDELDSGLEDLVRASAVEQIYIRGDSLANFGPVLRVMGIAKRSGVAVSLVGEPLSNR